MTIPATAPIAQDEEGMDPADTADYVIGLAELLEEGEAFTAIDFAVTAESALLGFTILDDAPHAPAEIEGTKVRIWLTVDPAKRADGAWAGKGKACGIEFTATTDSGRVFQRTAAVQVVQK